MKITILKENLLKGLNTVERIIKKNLTLPILNNVLITAKGNFLKLSTTNLELGINYWDLAKIEKEGEITVPGRVISNLISLLSETKLSIETKGQILYLQGENYKSQIKGLDPKDFPIIPKVKGGVQIDLNAAPLCSGILQVIDFCAITQTRPEISGVFFNFQKEQLNIVATDSFRLAQKTFFFEEPQEGLREAKSLILPYDTAREIINIFSDQEGKIKIQITPNQVMVESFFPDIKNPKIRLVSRLIEGEYPNYQEVIPKETKTKLILKKEEFLQQIKAVSLFCGRGNEIKLKVDPKKEKVEISAQNIELGEANSIIFGKIQGEKVEICFNYRFLIEGIEKIQEDQIIFELNTQEGPALIKPLKDQSYLYVIMPIKAS
jgi:DNA polymerase-3 subunit beta